jgi:ADP-ribose pyrophosphatase
MLSTLERQIAWRGPLFSVEVLRLRDEQGREHQREIVRHPGAVAVVPVLDGGPGKPSSLVLIRNERIAVERALWEVPAGKLEAGEDPVEAARRELAEETGYRAGSLRSLGTFYTSPGFTDECMHVFAAGALEPGSQALEGGEQIEVHVRTVEQVLEMIADGSIVDGKTLAAILLWRHLAERSSAS